MKVSDQEIVDAKMIIAVIWLQLKLHSELKP